MHGVHVYKNSNYKSIHVLSHPISRFWYQVRLESKTLC
jgi:hypothetical protein